ncbi:MAG: cyclic nucleotide-binding domain-containing protein, partial [Sphingobacteriales bacterium]
MGALTFVGSKEVSMGELLTPIRLLSHRLSGGVQLSRAEIDALGSIARQGRRFSRGETVVRQGDRSPYIILTADGWAFREKSLSDGRRQILAIMLPGELSEKGPMVPFGAPDTIVAATDLDTQSIDRQELAKAMEMHPRILQALLFEEISRH